MNPKYALLSCVALSVALSVAGTPAAAEETVFETRGSTFLAVF